MLYAVCSISLMHEPFKHNTVISVPVRQRLKLVLTLVLGRSNTKGKRKHSPMFLERTIINISPVFCSFFVRISDNDIVGWSYRTQILHQQHLDSFESRRNYSVLQKMLNNCSFKLIKLACVSVRLLKLILYAVT